MGTTNTKIEYPCDCGYNYGYCEYTSTFYLSYNRSVDIGTLYYKYHDDPIQYLGTFNDPGLEALRKLLNGEEGDSCSAQDNIDLEKAWDDYIKT